MLQKLIYSILFFYLQIFLIFTFFIFIIIFGQTYYGTMVLWYKRDDARRRVSPLLGTPSGVVFSFLFKPRGGISGTNVTYVGMCTLHSK